MNALVFYSSRDSKGKVDASGAFIPEAKAFAKRHGIPDEDVIGIDCTKRNPASVRRSLVIKELSRSDKTDLEVLAFFGHGWPDGIQFGFRRQHIPLLVESLPYPVRTDLKVGLFACLTAENDKRDSDRKNIGPGTDNGFADRLRDGLVRHGVTDGWVDAHKTAGHTNWNPYVVRMRCSDVVNPERGGIGGIWLVPPSSPRWKRWCKALRDKDTGLRYDFLVMDRDEIIEKIQIRQDI